MTAITIQYHKLIIISTHTLTWSVTSLRSHLLNDRTISTHTLTWSVTGKEC